MTDDFRIQSFDPLEKEGAKTSPKGQNAVGSNGGLSRKFVLAALAGMTAGLVAFAAFAIVSALGGVWQLFSMGVLGGGLGQPGEAVVSVLAALLVVLVPVAWVLWSGKSRTIWRQIVVAALQAVLMVCVEFVAFVSVYFFYICFMLAGVIPAFRH